MDHVRMDLLCFVINTTMVYKKKPWWFPVLNIWYISSDIYIYMSQLMNNSGEITQGLN